MTSPTADLIIHPRSAWIAPGAPSPREHPRAESVTRVTVHHSEMVGYEDLNDRDLMRAIHGLHTTGVPDALCRDPEHRAGHEWDDIGYQLALARQPIKHDGRWSNVLEARDGVVARGWNVVGSHVGMDNTGNLGIVLLGNLDVGRATIEQYRSLVQVIAKACRDWHLDPQGHDPITRKPVIAGHDDRAPGRGCPGGSFRPLLPGLRTHVARAVESGRVPRSFPELRHQLDHSSRTTIGPTT